MISLSSQFRKWRNYSKWTSFVQSENLISLRAGKGRKVCQFQEIYDHEFDSFTSAASQATSIHVSFSFQGNFFPFSKPQSTNETVKSKEELLFISLLFRVWLMCCGRIPNKTKGKAQKRKNQKHKHGKNKKWKHKKDFSNVKEQEDWKTFFSFFRLSANIPGNIFYFLSHDGGMSEDDIHVKIAPTSAEQQAVYWLNEFNLLQFFSFFPITFGKTFSPCAAVRCRFEGNQYFFTVSCRTCVCV